MKAFYSFLLFALLAASCKKEPVNQLSLLPPATQNGANTLGCLVNGDAFVPKNGGLFSGPPIKCQYGFSEHGYIFSIGGGSEDKYGSISSVAISTDSLSISEGETLPLTKSFTPGMAFADYAGGNSVSVSSYTTNAYAIGQLTITHLDSINLIVSGTFQFNAVDKSGDTVRITNGRFDVHYMP